MFKALYFLSTIALTARANYLCSRLNDSGVREEVILEQEEASNCLNDIAELCNCEELLVQCLIGPDPQGKFENLPVPISYAEQCDPDFCICTNHANYVEIAEQRVLSAMTVAERLVLWLDQLDQAFNGALTIEVVSINGVSLDEEEVEVLLPREELPTTIIELEEVAEVVEAAEVEEVVNVSADPIVVTQSEDAAADEQPSVDEGGNNNGLVAALVDALFKPKNQDATQPEQSEPSQVQEPTKSSEDEAELSFEPLNIEDIATPETIEDQTSNESTNSTTGELDGASPQGQDIEIQTLWCSFGTDPNGQEIYDEIDIVAWEVLCGGQNFTNDFCKCSETHRDEQAFTSSTTIVEDEVTFEEQSSIELSISEDGFPVELLVLGAAAGLLIVVCCATAMVLAVRKRKSEEVDNDEEAQIPAPVDPDIQVDGQLPAPVDPDIQVDGQPVYDQHRYAIEVWRKPEPFVIDGQIGDQIYHGEPVLIAIPDRAQQKLNSKARRKKYSKKQRDESALENTEKKFIDISWMENEANSIFARYPSNGEL